MAQGPATQADKKTFDPYMEKIMQQEKDNAEAQHKHDYSKKAQSFKSALSKPVATRKVNQNDLTTLYGGKSGGNDKKKDAVYDERLLEGEEYHTMGRF